MVYPERLYDVNVEPSLVQEVYAILKELNIDPLIKDKSETIDNKPKPVNLPKKVVLWSSPQPNWNPWLSKYINEASLATATLEQLSKHLKHNKYKPKSTYFQNLNKLRQLPIYAKKDEILDAIRKNSIIIIQGSTGCGKTTQVCQYILDEYLENNQGAFCNIICTQPRKLSATSIAKRVASERKETLGSSVGYSVRFDSNFPRTHGAILFCTLGTLLRKMENGIRGISHFIIDEIHERSLNNDFLMAILKDMVNYYPDVRVIFMSATLNTNLFHKYFNYCPIIIVEGMCHPVNEHFLDDVVQLIIDQPLMKNYQINPQIGADNYNNMNILKNYLDDNKFELSMTKVDFKIIKAILTHIEINIKIPGAVLIFLPGWNVILALKNYLTSMPDFDSSKCCILLLHSKLSREIQRKVFEPVSLGVRKVILSTNIAETSITIKDVVYVINYPKSKLKSFTSHNNMIHYDEVWVSKTNMQQRKGRAGRVKQGFCFHLCLKEHFDKMDDHITPEIANMPLHKIILSIKILQLGDSKTFFSKFIEPPSDDAITKALALLKEIKCIDQNEELTKLGCILAKLPIDPQIGRMMILGNILKIGDALAIIAAVNSNMIDLFILDKDNSLNQTQREHFGNRCSDHLTVLKAIDQCSSLCHNSIDTTNYCTNEKLYPSSLRTIKNAAEQLKELFIKNGFPEKCFEKQTINYAENGIHNDSTLDVLSAILTMGFYPNVCYHKDKGQVSIADEYLAIIHKTSINYKATSFPSPFFVFTEKIYNKEANVVSCKQMTMITPIHMLLFGSCNIKYLDKLVIIDDWIYLNMDVKTASAIVSLRPAIENLILKGSMEPNSILNLSNTDIKLIEVLKKLCDFNSGKYNLPTRSNKRKYSDILHENSKYPCKRLSKYGFQRKHSLDERFSGQYSSAGSGKYNNSNLFEVEIQNQFWHNGNFESKHN